jgi:predicted XRE-type DNA-binding protein
MPNTARNKAKAKNAKAKEPVRVEAGSGNVFADLGISQPDLALAKAKLVQQIRDQIAERGLTQVKAAELLGLDQPKVSALFRGRTDGYTIARLFKFLNLLGQHIEITIRPAGKNSVAAETRVIVG